MPFGPFVSRNLTLSARIRTLEQFTDIYGKMSDREIAAIYEYLNAIPLINPRPAACKVS